MATQIQKLLKSGASQAFSTFRSSPYPSNVPPADGYPVRSWSSQEIEGCQDGGAICSVTAVSRAVDGHFAHNCPGRYL